MESKQVWNTLDGSPEVAWESPLEKGVFHYPANSVEVEPPKFNPQSQFCVWNGNEWVVSEIPEPPELVAPVVEKPDAPPLPEVELDEPEPFVPTTYAEKRLVEYGTIEEQIEFITENGLEAWQTRVTEIKKKYPKE